MAKLLNFVHRQKNFRSKLVEHSDFEWRFKLVAITTADQDHPCG